MPNPFLLVLKGLQNTTQSLMSPIRPPDGPNTTTDDETAGIAVIQKPVSGQAAKKPASSRTAAGGRGGASRKPETERKLRSVTKLEDGADEPALYDFDISAPINVIDAMEPLKLVDRDVSLPEIKGARRFAPIEFTDDDGPEASLENGNAKTFSPPNGAPIPANVASPARLVAASPRRAALSGAKDPLSEDHFVVYHRRMEREEKRMQSIERERSLGEVDRVLAQRGILTGPSWRNDIRYITRITDTDDETAIDFKRRLTLQEIEAYLQKYRDWKKREALVKAQKRAGGSQGNPLAYVFGGTLDTPDETSGESDNDSVSDSSESEHEQTPVPSPELQRPDIIPVKPFTSFYKDPRKRPRFDVLVKRPARTTHAFGCEIPHMLRRDFEIPEHWKR